MANTQTSSDPSEPASRSADCNPRLAGLAFQFYKSLVSPVLHAIAPSRCLYLPTCSEYAYTAISRFGIVRGGWMAMRRFARCHPWGKGGLDPVPEGPPSAQPQSVDATSSVSRDNRTDHLP